MTQGAIFREAHLRVLVKYGEAGEKMNLASSIRKKVAIHTLITNQLSNGGWPAMHYVPSREEPAMKYSYRPLYI